MVKVKRKQNKGFTLGELLIVVAIIAVLVAISIPIFTSQLKKARFATNLANARSAKAAIFTTWLDTNEQQALLVYDIKTGTVGKPTYGDARDYTTWWGYVDANQHGSLYVQLTTDPSTWDPKTLRDADNKDLRGLQNRVYSKIGIRKNPDGKIEYDFYK